MTDENVVTVVVSLAGAFMAAALGGWLAGHYTMKAVELAHQRDVAQRAAENRELIQAFLQGISDELRILWKIYEEEAGADLKALPATDYFDASYPLTQDYFIFYRANAGLIGRIPDPQLRREIVAAYIRAMSMVDAHRLNNDLLGEYNEWRLRYSDAAGAIQTRRGEELRQQLVAYASNMRYSYTELSKSLGALFEILKRHGVS